MGEEVLEPFCPSANSLRSESTSVEVGQVLSALTKVINRITVQDVGEDAGGQLSIPSG